MGFWIIDSKSNIEIFYEVEDQGAQEMSIEMFVEVGSS